jgi:hypothetical protein
VAPPILWKSSASHGQNKMKIAVFHFLCRDAAYFLLEFDAKYVRAINLMYVETQNFASQGQHLGNDKRSETQNFARLSQEKINN